MEVDGGPGPAAEGGAAAAASSYDADLKRGMEALELARAYLDGGAAAASPPPPAAAAAEARDDARDERLAGLSSDVEEERAYAAYAGDASDPAFASALASLLDGERSDAAPDPSARPDFDARGLRPSRRERARAPGRGRDPSDRRPRRRGRAFRTAGLRAGPRTCSARR